MDCAHCLHLANQLEAEQKERRQLQDILFHKVGLIEDYNPNHIEPQPYQPMNFDRKLEAVRKKLADREPKES